jgi:hypothetical protein
MEKVPEEPINLPLFKIATFEYKPSVNCYVSLLGR